LIKLRGDFPQKPQSAPISEVELKDGDKIQSVDRGRGASIQPRREMLV
jgi:hypothetical protein